MNQPLTAAEIIKDIRALDRLEHDWLRQGRLDSITEKDLHDKKAELMETLRERFTTSHETIFGDWMAFEGDGFDLGIPTAYGATEIEAIECLLEMIGEAA